VEIEVAPAPLPADNPNRFVPQSARRAGRVNPVPFDTETAASFPHSRY